MNEYKIKCNYVSFDEMEIPVRALNEQDAIVLAKKTFFNCNAKGILKGDNLKALISTEVENEEVC